MEDSNEIGWLLFDDQTSHLILWLFGDGGLSRWVQWLMTSHVRRFPRHYKTRGHVWQGWFKAFPIQEDEHFLTVLRYVERNPLRGDLGQRSQDWEWSSLKPTGRSGPDGLIVDGPVVKPDSWTRFVHRFETVVGLKAQRQRVERGTPFGDSHWQAATLERFGLESSLRPRGWLRLGGLRGRLNQVQA